MTAGSRLPRSTGARAIMLPLGKEAVDHLEGAVISGTAHPQVLARTAARRLVGVTHGVLDRQAVRPALRFLRQLPAPGEARGALAVALHVVALKQLFRKGICGGPPLRIGACGSGESERASKRPGDKRPRPHGGNP